MIDEESGDSSSSSDEEGRVEDAGEQEGDENDDSHSKFVPLLRGRGRGASLGRGVRGHGVGSGMSRTQRVWA